LSAASAPVAPKTPDLRPAPAKPASTRAVSVAPAAPSQVQEAQQLLARLGYNVGTTDGVEGSRTRSAVRAYQISRGLNPDGAVNDSLLAGLRKDVNNRWAGSASTTAPVPAAQRESGWLASATRGLQKIFGRDFDSIRRPAEMQRYCDGNRDTWVFDEGVGKLVLCSRIVAAAAPHADDTGRP
jgi:peptidoglycan hydrolase-like protein with peptidoglycan-binding domain